MTDSNITTTTTTTYTYYHAGPLFTLADLHTNTLLASRIRSLPPPASPPILPQDLEQRDTSPHSIRDHDIKALLSCDLALFTYDGAELDSGTVVEYMIAKFADIPCVILRTDFRNAGDQQAGSGKEGGADAWNLMSSFWPRTVRMVVNSMVGYKGGLAEGLGREEVSGEQEIENVVNVDVGGGAVAVRAGERLLEDVARRVVEAMEEVVRVPRVMPRELREGVYEWLAIMPGFLSAGAGGEGRGTEGDVRWMKELLKAKETKGLL